MPPGAEGIFVRETLLRENVVEKFSPFLETVAVVVTAIEVKPKLGETLRMLG
jgi:hypothetical protein